MQQTSNTLVLSLIGLNNTSNKKQVSKSQFSTSQTNSCGRRRHSATQSTVFATASRISAIFRILLSLCSLHKNTGVNYFYFPGLVTSAVDRSRGRGKCPAPGSVAAGCAPDTGEWIGGGALWMLLLTASAGVTFICLPHEKSARG